MFITTNEVEVKELFIYWIVLVFFMTICGLIDLPVILMGIVVPILITVLIGFKLRHMKNKFLLTLLLVLILLVLIFGFSALAFNLGFGCTGPELEIL